jgi:hypothetical protein
VAGMALGAPPAAAAPLPAPPIAALRFTAAGRGIDIAREGGRLAVAAEDCGDRAAIAGSHPMRGGRHFAECEVVEAGGGVMLGLAARGLDLEAASWTQAAFWGVGSGDGDLYHGGGVAEWAGRQGFGAGDTIGLLLDCDAGTLAVYKNGARLGQAVAPGMRNTMHNTKEVAGLQGQELCWAVSLYGKGDAVRVASKPLPAA